MGASLLAIALCQPASMLADTPPSRAGSLPQGLMGQWECRGTSAPRQPTRKSKSQPWSACSTWSMYS
ncbi:hypothetical protein FGE05_22690 [Pseudomonas sp. ICMP22404]|nr:hypothetical protein FGE05_22690 [Pseudomonas sp. ICMP22404]